MAYEFETAKTATIKMNVATNEAGNIAQEGDTATGNKGFSLPGIKAGASFAEADKVFNSVIAGIAKGTYDKKSATKTITVGVVETE